MKKNRGKMKMGIGIAMMLVGGGLLWLAHAASNSQPTDGNPPSRPVQVSQADARATVFFWYGCPHCLKLEGEINALQVNDSEPSVKHDGSGYQHDLVYVPAVLNPTWELHARLYYALQNHGFSREGHVRMMRTVQANAPRTLDDLRHMLQEGALLEERKGNPNFTASVEEIIASLYSTEVDVQIERSITLTSQIGLKGVPTLLLGGSKVIELGSGVDYRTMALEATARSNQGHAR